MGPFMSCRFLPVSPLANLLPNLLPTRARDNRHDLHDGEPGMVP